MIWIAFGRLAGYSLLKRKGVWKMMASLRMMILAFCTLVAVTRGADAGVVNYTLTGDSPFIGGKLDVAFASDGFLPTGSGFQYNPLPRLTTCI
jgi:hypothetical protein